ncbi:MAG: hypothetical protein LBD75_01090 [Candidatus Peribacteria bacterium]|jgi:hypothetical protein|nr:hypothetical protein [Candidatus Peribacteria bacterium]
MKNTSSHQTSLYTKVLVSALIFLSTICVGGLAILTATNLDDLKAGANGHTLTSNSWDTLIDSVKTQNTALGVGLDRLETGLTQFNQTLINLFGSRDEKVRI